MTRRPVFAGAALAFVALALLLARVGPRPPAGSAITPAAPPSAPVTAPADTASSAASVGPSVTGAAEAKAEEEEAARRLAAFQARRPETLWQQMPAEEPFALFSEWAKRYVATGANPEDGARLAGIRRVELAKLIESDPQRALELAVPWSVRQQLPEAVRSQLEIPVSGRGDLTILAAFPAPGEPLGVPPVRWTATIAGQDYRAHVYGRRLGEPSRFGVALHGIALGGELALDESPARVLERAEADTVKAGLPAEPVCSISGQASTVNHDEVALDLGGEVKFLCSAAHAARLAASLEQSGDGLAAAGGGGGGAPIGEVAELGNRKILLIRVDFPDFTADPFTAEEGTNILATLSQSFSNWSYGRLITALAGEGSDVTPVYRMPTSNAVYNGNDGQLRTDARNAAIADGYDMNAYDLDAVCFNGGTSGWGYGGLAYVGGRGVWLHTTGASSTANIGTHEFGHNFGLNHANFYNAPFGTVIGAGGSNDEYGNPFDTMGSASTANTFGASQKRYLDWITNGPAGNEWVGLSSGTTTNRLYAHDVAQAPGLLKGIRVTRDTSLNNDKEYYWLEYRTTKANKALDNGVLINWAGSGNEKPQMLDTTPGSNPDASADKSDSALVVGRTYDDPAYNIHITPIGTGAGTPGWIDVVVRFGAFAGNDAPTVTVTAPATNAATGVSLSFSAAASDADGDALAYSWDYGDGDYSTSNNPNVSHSWSANGEYLVQCTVSDMKGGTARDSIVVRIGNPSVFSINGRVTLHNQPLPGVRVYTDSTNFTWSNSDGDYHLVGLPAGSYTVRAFQEGHTYLRSGFANPVGIGPASNNMNFAGGFPTNRLVNGGTRQVNQGGTNGPNYLTVFDFETASSNLVLTGVSGDTNLVPHANITFAGGTGTNRIVTVKPAPGAAGTVTNYLVITDTNGFAWTNTLVLQINPPAVLSGSPLTTPEDGAVNFDLWSRTTDNAPANTADSNVLFSVGAAVNGTVTLISNRTARFQPATNFNGAASFAFTATDKGYDSTLLFYYDFEPTDSPGDNASSDRSGNARNGTLDRDGTGVYDYVTNDAPAALAPFSLVSLHLTDNGNSNSARLYRALNTTEYNLKSGDWSFATWFKRDSTTSDDFLFHFGDGDGGGGSVDELELMFNSGSQTLRLRHYNASTNVADMQLTSGSLATSLWHHVAVTFDRTNGSTGNFRLYVNGTLTGSASNISLLMTQDFFTIGGHDATNNTQRWFDGSFDDVALWRRLLASNEVAQLAAGLTVAHFGGLDSTTNIGLTFTPVNDPPALAALSNRSLIAGATLVVSNSATDVDLPGDTLTFSLVSAPADATINPATGQVGWRPAITNGGFSNLFAVKVADAGAPSLSATQQFYVTVLPAATPLVSALALTGGDLGFQVSGDAGPDYHLLATTNMVDWITLQTWSNAAAFPLNWSDTNAAKFQHRFYEIRLGP